MTPKNLVTLAVTLDEDSYSRVRQIAKAHGIGFDVAINRLIGMGYLSALKNAGPEMLARLDGG